MMGRPQPNRAAAVLAVALAVITFGWAYGLAF